MLFDELTDLTNGSKNEEFFLFHFQKIFSLANFYVQINI